MDTSKHLFQPHGVNAAEKVVLCKKLRREEMVAFFKTLAADDHRDRSLRRIAPLDAAATVVRP